MISLSICSIWAQEAVTTDQDLFEQLFGRKPQEARQLSLPFTIDEKPRGEIQVLLHPNQEAKVDVETLLEQLNGGLQVEVLARIKEKTDGQGGISLADLNQLGVESVFDESRLELEFKTAPSIRAASRIELSGQSPQGAENALKPSDFSAYINLRTGLDYVPQTTIGVDEGFQPFRADLEGAFNLRNWVIEGTGSYAEDAPSLWRRGGLRLVRDDPERMIRYSAGDLAYPTTGFQTFQPMLGVMVARNFSLQPYRVTEPRGRTSFFLRGASTVEVFVNGQQIQTLQLPAGPHNIQDFLLASGGNDITLRIIDDVGRVETIRLSFFFDARLLARGVHEFSYSLGLPSRPGEMGPEYDFESPSVTLFHRVGLTDKLTAGLNFQGNEFQQIVGAETVWATPVGTFQPDVAFSSVEDFGGGYATRLGYRYYDAASTWGSALVMASQYTSPGFASLGNLWPANVSAWNFSARYSQRLMLNMHGGVGGTYQLRRQAPKGLAGLNLFLGKRFGATSFVDLTFDRRETVLGQTEYRAYLSFTMLFAGGRQSVRASHDTFVDTTRADWRFASPHQVGGFDGNIGIQQTPDDYSLFGAGRYTGYRSETTLSQDITTPSGRNEGIDSRTRLRFGTALVYADGTLAVSRPVHDSFAMVKPHPELKGQKIGVDPIREVYSAKIDRLGPAVVPDLSSYLFRNLTIDAPELPAGYELGPGVYTVHPTYRSATVIRVGTGATVLVDGILLAEDGTPVSLQLGEIVPAAEPHGSPIEFFTNRGGRFNVEGLKPGRHEIRLFETPARRVLFEVPEGKAGLYNIGMLRLQSAGSDEQSSDGGIIH